MGALRDLKRWLGVAKALPNDELPVSNARHQTKQVRGLPQGTGVQGSGLSNVCLTHPPFSVTAATTAAPACPVDGCTMLPRLPAHMLTAAAVSQCILTAASCADRGLAHAALAVLEAG